MCCGWDATLRMFFFVPHVSFLLAMLFSSLPLFCVYVGYFTCWVCSPLISLHLLSVEKKNMFMPFFGVESFIFCNLNVGSLLPLLFVESNTHVHYGYGAYYRQSKHYCR